MSTEPILYYFDGRGLGEIIRMMLCAAKIKYREVDFTSREQFVKMMEDGELLYNQVPMLKMDGMNLTQANAVTRYISRKADLDGKDAEQRAWVDMYYEGSRDLNAPFLAMLFPGQSLEDTMKRIERGMAKFLPVFDKALEKSTSGFLVGSTMTRADIGLFEPLLAITDYYDATKLDAYPHLKAFVCKMSGVETMAYYLKEIRKGNNTEEYVANAVEVLAF